MKLAYDFAMYQTIHCPAEKRNTILT